MKRHAPLVLAILLFCFAVPALCQTETATISGRVSDPQGAVISGAEIQVQNVLTGWETVTRTNSSGLYVIAALQPGTYRVIVSNPGFKQIVKPGVILNVQDNASLNFAMTIGSASETVTVEGGAPMVNTQDATVSTVVNRNLTDNLPMNGRSFQTLIELTPGVVLTSGNLNDGGQFSVNGQRASSNYWMVDGVSANVGISPYSIPGNGLSGALGSFSTAGGTNSLVSIDAMQEFRIQTSTYAPEFGRTPGAQISILTRSGTNQFHGTVFDYLRNDALDASDWFNGYTNTPPLPKAKEQQNDFGGTFSGPIVKDRAFFFFSYEGLRLRLPRTQRTTVPDVASRQSAQPAIQPFLNAFPLPNGTDLGSGIAEFNASFSNPSTLDAYSLRLDHKISNRLKLFARYDYSPSALVQRGATQTQTLSQLFSSSIQTQTATLGATFLLSPTSLNDLRVNFSKTRASSRWSLDNFGGAIPLGTVPFPSPYTAHNADFSYSVLSLTPIQYLVGTGGENVQRQLNFVDSFSSPKGSHSLKFGVDYRHLFPIYAPPAYQQNAFFGDVPSAEVGSLLFGFTAS